MGRFFFPALSSLAILMFYGLSLLVSTADGRRPINHKTAAVGRQRSAVGVLALAANLFMLAISLIALFGDPAPAYARPAGVCRRATLPNATDIRFDSFVALRGYAVDTDAARPGESIGIELIGKCWQRRRATTCCSST